MHDYQDPQSSKGNVIFNTKRNSLLDENFELNFRCNANKDNYHEKNKGWMKINVNGNVPLSNVNNSNDKR